MKENIFLFVVIVLVSFLIQTILKLMGYTQLMAFVMSFIMILISIVGTFIVRMWTEVWKK